MNESNDTATTVVAPPTGAKQPKISWSLHRWVIAVVGLVIVFSSPLWQLVRFSLQSALYSHIVLVPFVSAYLIWINRRRLPPLADLNPKIRMLPVCLGVLGLSLYAIALISGRNLAPLDFLALTMCAFVLALGAITTLCLGTEVIRRMMFPASFLALMIPMPSVVNAGVETVLQHGSASVAYALFSLAGTPLFRQDLIFQLPGITLEVAPECSGIRSTLALFITSLVAGYMFLDSPWKRAVLAAVVLPLALLRNGFRVFTIGELCVHVSPDMIDSYIHHKGGPIFFLLSLIPFSLVLLALIRSERHSRRRESVTVVA